MKNPLRRAVFWVGGVLGLLLAPELIGLVYFKALPHLLGGWVAFMRRTFPLATMNWSGLGFAAIAGALAVALTHWLGQRLLNGNDGTPGHPVPRWKFGYSLALCGGLVLLFAISLAGGGIVTNALWLRQFDGPTLVNRHGEWDNFREMDLFAWELEETARECQWRHAAFAQRMSTQPSEKRLRNLERFAFLPLVARNGEMKGGLVFPRNPSSRQKFGCSLISPPREVETIPQSDALEKILAAGEQFEPVLARFLAEPERAK